MQRLFPIVAASALASTSIAAAGAAESTDNNASLRDEVRALQQNYDRQLQALEQRLAQAESRTAPAGNTAFNPSIAAILSGSYRNLSQDPAGYRLQGFAPGGEETGPGSRSFSLGESELTISANADHLFKGTLTFSLAGDNSVGVEEAKLETLALDYGASAMAGRFLSGLGYLNNQHSHSWDFVDLPLAYQAFYGSQYRNDGIQLRWLAPLDRMLELGVEAGNGEPYPGSQRNRNGAGAVTGFVRLGDDIGDGFSWQANGWYQHSRAEQRSFAALNGVEQPLRDAFSGRSASWGLAAVAKYSPAGSASRQFKLAGEYLRRRETGELTYDADGAALQDGLRSVQSGWYLQAGYRFADNWRASLRHDRLDSGNVAIGLVQSGVLAAADFPTYAAFKPRRDSASLDYLPSEFSRIRLQYNRDVSQPARVDNQVLLQYTLSLGAHGAHQY